MRSYGGFCFILFLCGFCAFPSNVEASSAPLDIVLAVQSHEQAAFPFYDGFESGTLGPDWTVYTTNDGRVQVGTDYPSSGAYALLLDDSANDSNYSTAAAILTIDLSGQSQVDLDFWIRDFLDESHPEDGVFISADNGANWYQVFSFDTVPSFYRHYIIDLDEAAATHSLAFNDHFQVKFQFRDDDPIPSDGFAIDEVQLRVPPVPIPASFPYYNGFESGVLGDEWLVGFSNEGRVQVGDYEPFLGTYSLLLDDSRSDSIYSTAAAILTIDLNGQLQVDLDFWMRDFLDESHPEDGVFVSDDNGANWYQVFSFDTVPSFYRHYIIDLDEAAAAYGLVFNDHFQVKFQFRDDDPIPSDGFAIDEVQLCVPPVPIPATFPYYNGFESGTLGDEWLVGFSNEGRVQVSDYEPFLGTYSLLLDDSRSDSTKSLAVAILTINLDGQSQVDLDFWGRNYLDFPDAEDGIFVSDDSGATWHQIFSLYNMPGFYRHYVMDLDAKAADAGLTLNDHFQIKFQFYGEDPIPSDGYAIDEIRLRVPPVPIPAAFPYYNGFESGALGDEWLVSFSNEGRVRVGDYEPFLGTYSLLLDDSRSDSTKSLAVAILTINLDGQSQVDLDFWGRNYLDFPDAEDGVFISDDSGATWHQIFSLYTMPGFYRHYVMDLDAKAADAGLTLNDHFQIKFQFYGEDPIPADGYAIDEIRLRVPPVPIPATFPYYNGFESGTLGDEWLVGFSNEGRVQVSTAYSYAGTHSLLLDDARDDSTLSIAAAILTVNLSGHSGVMVDFWWREFYDEDHNEDGVFISADGTTWHKVLSFNGGTSSWQREIMDLDALAVAAGLAYNDHFQIKFQFYDDDPIPADGYAIDELRVRSNVPPTLAWLGWGDYEQDGLHPESGDVGDTYYYRIQYADCDNDLPGIVQVHIERAGIDIAGSPFTMNCAAGNYLSGVTCSHDQVGLEEGLDYTYHFDAQDDRGHPADPTLELDAPDVFFYQYLYLPLVMGKVGPPAEPPVLDPIDNPEGHYRYTVSWSVVDGATGYTLEEDDNAAFSSPETVYSGSSTSVSLLAEVVGTYYYRVNASNQYGKTGWSNIESTEVTVPLPPCPQAGTWAGWTNQGYLINFTVADTPDCKVTSLTITALLDCIFSPYDIEYTRHFLYSTPIVAWEFQYYVSGTNYTDKVAGTFTTQTSANGNWYFFIPDPNFPGRFCVASGTWNASH